MAAVAAVAAVAVAVAGDAYLLLGVRNVRLRWNGRAVQGCSAVDRSPASCAVLEVPPLVLQNDEALLVQCPVEQAA